MSVPQLPLALRAPPDQRFDSYIAAPDGLLAQLQALAAGQVSDWLYLSGPAGSGKTHLALSLCAAAEQAGRMSAYLPLQAAAGRLRDALEALEGRSLVALDGVESIAGQRDDEVALFDFSQSRARGWHHPAVHRAPDAQWAGLGVAGPAFAAVAMHPDRLAGARRCRTRGSAARPRAASRPGHGRSGDRLAADAWRARTGQAGRFAGSPGSRIAGR